MGVCIVLDRPGDWEEFEASEAKQMNELLTTLHLEVVILDLKIKMMEAIESGHFDLAMTMQLGHALVLYDQVACEGGGHCTDIKPTVRCDVCGAKEVDQYDACAFAGAFDCEARED